MQENIKYLTELSQRIYLSKKYPLIIRLDGVNITKNHDIINLIVSNFTKEIFQTGIKIFKKGNYTGYVFAILDEINFAFYTSSQFLNRFDDSNQIYCGSIFLQDFLRYLPSSFSKINFGLFIFNVNNIDYYLRKRKHITYQTAVMYFAKEHLEKKLRHNIPTNEILDTIKKDAYLYQKFNHLEKEFLNGYLYNNNKFISYIE